MSVRRVLYNVRDARETRGLLNPDKCVYRKNDTRVSCRSLTCIDGSFVNGYSLYEHPASKTTRNRAAS